MRYNLYEIPIVNLIHLIESGKLDLKPSYQRNEVWSRKDQESLIDTILFGFPIPNFFFFKKGDGSIEMVDGQQRARAIYNFYKGLITDSQKRKFQDIQSNDFLEYRIYITEIVDLLDEDLIRNFYVLVNKKGVQLNKPEITKAEFASTKFLSLVEELLENQSFNNLDLFTDSVTKRMNDRSYVEELVAYLLLGITDKKNSVEKIYSKDIDDDQYTFLKNRFQWVLERLTLLNTYKEINSSRYKQRNDFYTLFNFINEGIEVDNIETLVYQYRILLKLDKFVSPSNVQCEALKQYANNCITQSNSKKSRIERLSFFEKILRNKVIEENETLQDVYNFLFDIKEVEKMKLVNGYQLFDLDHV